ncbi:MAG TPA: DUF4388 domain-containing protein [Candidatus Obscuribacter sp.]|nr:DUF4388 domain-containing protein [Candidatus Obscuribacter sp.]HND07233.1 DUF4388 domain-containing protein [Candidatus Obscuribacter sp.]
MLLAKFSCQATAVGQAFLAIRSAGKQAPYDAEDVLRLRRQFDLAFVCLIDSQGEVLAVDPKSIPTPILTGPAFQFVDRYGWSMFRLKDEDQSGKTLMLATYGMSLFSFSQSTVFGPSPQFSFVELLYIFAFELMFVSAAISFAYVRPLRRMNDLLMTLGEKSGSEVDSLLAAAKEVPWYYICELRELNGLLRLRLGSLNESSRAQSDSRVAPPNEHTKWRSTTLELERVQSNFVQGHTRVPIVVSHHRLEELQDELLGTVLQQVPCNVLSAFIFTREDGGVRGHRWILDRALSVDGRDCRPYAKDFEGSNIGELCDGLAASQKALSLGQMLLSQYRVDGPASMFQAQSALCMPLLSEGRCFGVLFLLAARNSSGSIPALERIWRNYEAAYFSLNLERTSMASSQIDRTTGLKNRKHVVDSLKADTQGLLFPVVMGLCLPDKEEISQSGLLDYTVNLLNEFSRIWHDGLNMPFEAAVMEEGQFVLLCHGRGEDATKMLQALGPFLLSTFTKTSVVSLGTGPVEGHGKTWNYGNVGVVFGVDFAVEDGGGASRRASIELLRRAARACEYAKTQGGSGFLLVQASEVPQDFQDFSLGKSLSGKLGIFDVSEILQSLSSGRRTGRFTVEDRAGRLFHAWLENGKLVSLHLEQDAFVLAGLDALLELISTFHGGEFTFVELPVPHQSLQELPALVNCLMEAALACDQLETARLELSPGMRLKATLDGNARARLLQAEGLEEAQVAVMKEIEALAREGVSLESILEQIPYSPTARKWHCALLMKRYGLLQEVGVANEASR